MLRLLSAAVRLVAGRIAWVGLAVRPRKSLAAEILFLRRQLALYIERGVKPQPINPVMRVSLALLSRFFNWRDALVGCIQ